jgi:ATP-binding cassette, subfamily B, bacterial
MAASDDRKDHPLMLPTTPARRGWVRRLLPYLRLKPFNLALTFVAAVAAGLAATALLLVQRDLLDLAVAGDLLAMYDPLALLIGLGVLNYGAQRVAAYRELKAANDTQFLVYDAVHRRMQYIDADAQSLPPGQLAARLNADIDAMSRAVASVPKLGGALATTAATLALMLSLHPLVGLIPLLIVPLLWLTAARSRRRVRPATWIAQQREAEVAQLATMAIGGVRVVKSLGQEPREIERMAATSGQLYGARLRLIRLRALFEPVLEAIPSLAQVLVVLAGGWLILRDEITLGTLLAFIIYIGQLAGGVKWFADSVVRLQEAGVCAGRVLDLLELPPAVVDDPRAPDLPEARGEVVFDDVRFAYGDGAPVLDGFSLRVAPGETVVLVGVAGSGKSTVVKLLARFHDPSSGAVRIDGVDLREVSLASVRRQVGVVFDDPMLFAGTIRNAIAYGRPDADPAAVEQAARTAGAHDFITMLPDGYDTHIGERGYTLSGGQRQRLALARTLLTRPGLLALDDPTAGVDAEMEREIHRRLRAHLGRRTTLHIGYRASTVAVADRIVVVDAGRVVDSGRHEELMLRCPLYRRLVDPAAAQAAAAADAPDERDDTGTTPAAWPAPTAPRRRLGPDAKLSRAVGRLGPERDVAPPVTAVPGPGETFSVWRLLRPQSGWLVVGAAMLILLTLVELAGPYFVRDGVDNGVLIGSTQGITLAALAIFIANLVGLVLSRPTMILTGRVGQRIVHALRLKVWAHMVHLPVDYYERSRAGRLLTLMVNDVEAFSRFASTGLVTAVVSSLTVVGAAVVMFIISPALAMLVLFSTLPFVLVLRRYNGRIAAAYGQAREHVAEANAALQENLAGIREAQAFGQHERQHTAYRELTRRYLRFRLAAERLAAATYPVVSFLSGLALSLVLAEAAVRLAEGSLSAGDLIGFVLCVAVFFPPIVEFAIFLTSDVKRVAVSTRRIGELMAERVRPTALTAVAPAAGSPVARSRGEVRLAGIRFTYPGTPTEVLHGVDLTVPAGTAVALVGPTGAGKSTILKLMARFYDPSAGQVLLDGTDLRDLDAAALHSRLGYLPQEPYLFTGSIRDNIAYGRPEASDREVEAAARAVGAHEGIAALSGGYRHVVGERGGALSAGLRQLVCLARVYLVDPAIVLLDEATAKLDLATEARVLHAIREVTRGRTTIMIAHRLQTAVLAEQILMVSDGGIVEFGTHDELVAADGRYAGLYDASVLTRAA